MTLKWAFGLNQLLFLVINWGPNCSNKKDAKEWIYSLGDQKAKRFVSCSASHPFYRLIAFDLYPTACFSEQQYKWKQCVTQNGKKRVEGELSTEVCWRSSKGVVNIMANYWTEQRQGAGCTSEPFFLTISLQFFLKKKNDIVGIFIFIFCQLLSQLAQKDKIHSQAAR